MWLYYYLRFQTKLLYLCVGFSSHDVHYKSIHCSVQFILREFLLLAIHTDMIRKCVHSCVEICHCSVRGSYCWPYIVLISVEMFKQLLDVRALTIFEKYVVFIYLSLSVMLFVRIDVCLVKSFCVWQVETRWAGRCVERRRSVRVWESVRVYVCVHWIINIKIFIYNNNNFIITLYVQKNFYSMSIHESLWAQ